MTGKLTHTQQLWLRSLRTGGRYHIGKSGSVKVLILKGLAETNEFGCTIITLTGRALLEPQTPPNQGEGQ